MPLTQGLVGRPQGIKLSTNRLITLAILHIGNRANKAVALAHKDRRRSAYLTGRAINNGWSDSNIDRPEEQPGHSLATRQNDAATAIGQARSS